MKLVKLQFRIDSPQDYNLDLTLKPSFVSSLYVKRSAHDWVKQAGLYAGIISLRQRDCDVEAYAPLNADARIREVILHELGLWDEKPSSRIARLSGSLREQVKALSELFPGVRLSIAPHDFNCIFIAVVLSKRAKYDVFVRKWIKDLWGKWHCSPEIIARLKPEDIKSVGTSYQLTDLIKTLRDYIKISARHGGIEEIRRVLMLCWGVGPKVADATLLFTSKSPWIVPCDTHLQRISRRLNWVERGVRMPTKSLCLRYYCDECIDRYGPCLRKEIERLFLGFGGWVQTLTYLFGNSICTSQKPKCSLCHPTLREYCKRDV